MDKGNVESRDENDRIENTSNEPAQATDQDNEAKLKALSENKRNAGIIFLVIGLVVLSVIVFSHDNIYNASCPQEDPNGWCGFGVFLSTTPFIAFGLVMIILGFSEYISYKRIKKGKSNTDTIRKDNKSSTAKEFFKRLFLAVLAIIALFAIPAFFSYISSPSGGLSSAMPAALVFCISLVLIMVILKKWK